MRRQVLIDTADKAAGVINVPHYWAIYYHEGRRVITPVSANFLVWFKDPKDDPRLINGKSPINRSDLKRLNLPASELRRLRKEGKLFMVKRSPRTGEPRFTGNPFFSNKPGGGMFGFNEEFKRLATKMAYDDIEAWLRRTGLKKKTIRVRISE
jgi:hypothetical protein